MTNRFGFVLVIVLLMLGAIAVVALNFAGSVRMAGLISEKSVDQSRVRLLARSALEMATTGAVADFESGFSSHHDSGPLGRGTYRDNGDLMESDIRDSSGCINLNDGLDAGELELGSAYQASSLDPWPSVTGDPSAWINLRLRRLLNAYGDSHKFVCDLGWPQHNRVLFEAGLKGSYNAPFSFTSTAVLDRGVALPADITSSGLGDRVIANRPQNGFAHLQEVMGIVNEWGQEFLDPSYLNGQKFYDLAKFDFSVNGLLDPTFTRMKREFGDFSSDVTKAKFSPRYLDEDPPDFTGLWSKHPVALVNMNIASDFVKAAIFYAPTNVSYLINGAQTLAANPTFSRKDIAFYSMNLSGRHAPLRRPSIGVGPPVFDPRFVVENGYPDFSAVPLVAQVTDDSTYVQKNRFMSLRDALVLAKSFNDYANENPVRNFDDFASFLNWSQVEAPDLERALPTGMPYNDQHDAGFFGQDYVAAMLPHLYSCVRRLPGYLGAPAALLSPYRATIPINEFDLTMAGLPYEDLTRSGQRHCEDFVFRHMHPKICFQPSGYYEIDSTGTILDRLGNVKDQMTIRTSVRLFRTKFLRSQADFEDCTDEALSDSSIRIGPNQTVRGGGLADADGFLGHVGLYDHEEEDLSALKLRMNFTKDFSALGVPPTVASADSAWDWLENSGIPVPAGQIAQVKDSAYEGVGSPFLAQGNSGSELSPFNGVFLSSLGHGVRAAGLFNDSLYWRPNDPSAPLMDINGPTGQSLGKGLVSFWFRIPSGYEEINDFPYQASTYLRYTIRTSRPPILVAVRSGGRSMFAMARVRYELQEQSDVITNVATWTDPNASIQWGQTDPGRFIGTHHSMLSLNLWDAYDPGSGGEKRRPTHLNIAFKNMRDPVTGSMKKKIVTHYENFLTDPQHRPESENNSGVWNYGWSTSPLITSPYAPSSLSDLLTVPYNAPDSYSMYRSTLKRINRREITLKDTPENGPGSWHKVTVGWDMEFDNIDSQKRLWMALGDGSNIDSEAEGDWYCEYSGSSSNHFDLGTGDSNMVMSLGETHMRWENNMLDLVTGHQYNRGEYFPAYRLESNIDNLQVAFGGPIPDKLAPAVQTSLRYDVSSSPAWVINPKLPVGARVIHAGCRVYYPPDEQNNFPVVAFDVIPAMSISKSYSDNEQDLFIGNLILAPTTRLKLSYRPFKPSFDGNPLSHGGALVNSGTDNWSDLPWIEEVSLSYRDKNEVTYLSWETE